MNLRSSGLPPARRWLLPVLVFLLGWVGFMVLMCAQHVLSGAFTWTDSWRMTLNQWLPWMVFSPLIIWLVWRFPFERNNWKSRAVIHAGACALVVMSSAVAGDFLFMPPQDHWGPGGPMRPHRGRLTAADRADAWDMARRRCGCATSSTFPFISSSPAWPIPPSISAAPSSVTAGPWNWRSIWRRRACSPCMPSFIPIFI